MNLNFLTKLLRKDEWPEGKEIRFKIFAKNSKKETVIYLTSEQMNILVATINLGCEVLSMPVVVATLEQKSTSDHLMS